MSAAIPLLQGPRITHYWEESGIIGRHYQDVLDVDMYAWDIWMLYGPDAEWTGILPPMPDFWQHQLPGLPRDQVLDAGVFAAETARYFDRITAPPETAPETAPASAAPTDTLIIPAVAQPRGVAIGQHIRGRGGYSRLKQITGVRETGHIESGGRRLGLEISMSRPEGLQRIETTNGKRSVARSDQGVIRVDPTGQERGLPEGLESKLLARFDFDGPLVEWKEKGSEIVMVGMQKLGKVLAWKLSLTTQSGDRERIYINSHDGTMVRIDLLDEAGQAQFVILQSDFREVSGFRFAHRIEYRAADGSPIATEIIDHIIVSQ